LTKIQDRGKLAAIRYGARGNFGMTKIGLKSGLTAFSIVQGLMLGSAGVAFADTSPAPGSGDATGDSSTGIEQVVVTATKRAENVQEIPFKVSALSEADLKARGALTVEDAISFIPGVSYTSNGANAGSYTIRGVNTSAYAAGTQSPVAVYIDDLNILDPFSPKITPSLRLFDMNRVEVLEGPQGTLFGSGSIGGAIRIISNKPNLTDYEAETEDTVEDTSGAAGSYETNVMANIPIVSDELALRVVGYYDQDGGYIDNTARDERDANRSISEGARVQLEFVPISDLTLIASAQFDVGRPHDSAFSFYNSKQYQWNGLLPNTNYDSTDIYGLTGTYDLGWSNFTSITTYADRKENSLSDFSADAAHLLGIHAPSPERDYGPTQTFSEEARLASPTGQRFSWLIGGVYINERRTNIEPIDVPGSGAAFHVGSDIVSLSDDQERISEEAAFGEVSYNILPDLTATAGLRVFNDHQVRDQVIGGTLEPHSSNVSTVNESSETPKFNLSYHLDPEEMIYAQVAKGYRIGQSNPVSEDPISHEPIPSASTPDSLWDYELGEKSSFLKDHLIVNASVYYIDWSNIQLNELTQPSGINFIGNAGVAHIEGTELDVEAKLEESWDVGGSLSYNDAKLVSVNPAAIASKGDQLPGSAPLTVVAYTEYNHSIGHDIDFFGRFDIKWGGREYSNLVNSTSLTYGNTTNVNLRAGIQWDRYSISVFANNALDGDGKTAAFSTLGQTIAIRQQPTTFGLTFDAKL
jgi:iron complex outermembrane recepter protein